MNAAEMVVLLEGSPISTEELWSSVRVAIRVLGHLPDLPRAASSRKSLGGSKLLLFKNVGGHCVLGDLQCCRMFWYPSPDLCLDTILSLTFPANCGTLYKQVCAFPNRVQSIEFTTGGLQ